MKQKKMTKRQILNELLVVEEKKAAIAKSADRLQTRRNNLRGKHCDLAEQLEAMCDKELVKAGAEGDAIEPIIFKNKIFEVEPGDGYHRTAVVIQGAKSVK